MLIFLDIVVAVVVVVVALVAAASTFIALFLLLFCCFAVALLLSVYCLLSVAISFAHNFDSCQKFLDNSAAFRCQGPKVDVVYRILWFPFTCLVPLLFPFPLPLPN